ncbi:MAG: CDP-archaeol synthase [Gammaproteobacteria bacterium]|nr:CDP-archaeol synthase [Gammaproteobacteria bacterium]
MLLLCMANTAAWAAGRVLGDRWAAPIDFGVVLKDGQRLFGSHKTWRGLIAAAAATGLLAAALGPGFLLGAAFGATSMVGDALSSTIKRRLRREPGTEVALLDQVPEAMLPLAVFGPALGLGFLAMVGVTLAFTLLDIAVTGFRHRP